MRNTKIKTKTEKGITLIALIITIVVLLILAVVAINSIQNDGIISKAEQIANKYNESVQNEATQLQDYVDVLNQYTEGSSAGQNPVVYAKVSDAKNDETVFVVNTTLQDDFGNLVKVPAGFKIAEDSATAVTGGVVIEDATYTDTIGSQFVWIPTGNIKTSTTDTVGTTIELNRYTFAADGTPTPHGDAAINTYFEELETTKFEDAYYGNETAINLTQFLASAKPVSEGGNGGYYIGRYEAGVQNGKAVCKNGISVATYNADQSGASTLSRNMYGNGYGTGTLTSDLVNSYAWDTAIVFIQEFGGEEASAYSVANKGGDTVNSAGENGDEFCKINDMSGNLGEWSTETGSEPGFNVGAIFRGGNVFQWSGSNGDACSRVYWSDGIYNVGFRPIIYLGLES